MNRTGQRTGAVAAEAQQSAVPFKRRRTRVPCAKVLPDSGALSSAETQFVEKKKLVLVILPQKLGAQHFRVNTICIITLSKNDVPSASHEEASDSVAARSQRPKDSCVPGL